MIQQFHTFLSAHYMECFRKAELVIKAIIFHTLIIKENWWWVHTLPRGHHSGIVDKRDTTCPLLLKGVNLICLLGPRKLPEAGFYGVSRSVPRKKLGNLIIKSKCRKIRESQKANSISLGLEESYYVRCAKQTKGKRSWILTWVKSSGGGHSYQWSLVWVWVWWEESKS